MCTAILTDYFNVIFPTVAAAADWYSAAADCCSAAADCYSAGAYCYIAAAATLPPSDLFSTAAQVRGRPATVTSSPLVGGGDGMWW